MLTRTCRLCRRGWLLQDFAPTRCCSPRNSRIGGRVGVSAVAGVDGAAGGGAGVRSRVGRGDYEDREAIRAELGLGAETPVSRTVGRSSDAVVEVR